MQITATRAARSLRELLDRASHRNEVIEIVRYGRVVARLVPPTMQLIPAESVVPQLGVNPGENPAGGSATA